MSNSHGSTSGHFARPKPSGSGGSFQSQHQQDSDDDLPRRPSVGASPRTEIICKGRHPPDSQVLPPSSPTSLTSLTASENQKCAQQYHQQQSRDKSVITMGKDSPAEVVSIPFGATSTATPAGLPQERSRAASSSTPIRVDATERLSSSGEETARTKPKRFRHSSLSTDVQAEHHTQSSPTTDGRHTTDIMRTDTFTHTCIRQNVAESEGSIKESSKGKTVAEIHAHEDSMVHKSQSAGHHSQKVSLDYQRHSQLDSTKLQQGTEDPLPRTTGECRSRESRQVSHKRSKMTTESSPTNYADKTSQDSTESKSAKTSGDTSTTPAPSIEATKELPGFESKNELVGVSRRIQSALPSEDMWGSNLDPNQLLEERLSATVIRRHVKVKPSATAKSQPEPKLQAETTLSDTSKNIADIHQEIKVSKDGLETELVKREQDHVKTENHQGHQDGFIQSTTQTPLVSAQTESSFVESKLTDSAQKTAIKPADKAVKKETSSNKRSDQDRSKREKSSSSQSGETKKTTVPTDDKAPPMRKQDAFQKTPSGEMQSLQRPRKESSLVKDRSPSVKSQGTVTKHVSIREPQEMMIMGQDMDSSMQASASSSPTVKDKELPGPSAQKTVGESDTSPGTWVEDSGRGVVSKAEVNRLANPRNSKSCCFCWCCCCSCSCLSVENSIRRTKDEKPQKSTAGNLDHYFNGDGESQPTLEDIRMWGESFDKLMKCGAGRKVFREFLQCEYSEENILFWLACEDLKKETNPEIIEEKSRKIYEEFISILSPREVSLDSRVRDVVNKNMICPTANTFDEAQLQIYTLMHRDSYPRFVNSAIYRKLAQLPAPSRKGSMA